MFLSLLPRRALERRVCAFPVDLLKTRIQQPDHLQKPRLGVLPRPSSTFVLGTARDIARHEGVRGLWRGTTPSLLRNVPGVALYFTGLNQLRGALARAGYFAALRAPAQRQSSTSTLPKLTAQGNLIAGAVTRVSVGLALNPFSVIKARYEVCLPNVPERVERP